jgi:tRNA(Arg) A34 adenosine deaminase TadA
MRAAIEEALTAEKSGNYPIGAVLVRNDEIVARMPNITRTRNDPTQHAEIEVIRKALADSGQKFLEDCILYTTHEPCPMCATAAVWAKLRGVVFGARLSDMITYGQTHGNKQWAWRTVRISAAEIFEKGDPKVELIGDFLRKECNHLFHS